MATDETERVPPRWARASFLALSLAGLAVAADLTLIHVKVHTDPAYRSFCAISEEINCDTVAQSEWSVFLGVPTSVWGMVGYLLMGVLAAWGLSRRRLAPGWPAGLLVLLSGFSVLVALGLGVVSKLVIGSMCLMCIASWAISAGLLLLAWLQVRPTGAVAAVRADLRALLGHKRLFAGLVAAGVGAVLALIGFYPRYWELDARVGPGGLAHGQDAQGVPWIGAQEPRVTIVEFSDYQCPHCVRAHHDLRRLVERLPGVRLAHRHYPLDQACNPTIRSRFHPAACERARAALCAEEQGRFWEMNDLLFLAQHQPALDLTTLARQLRLDLPRFRACLEAPATRERLAADLAEGRRVGVRGTPTFQIGDTQFVGQVPPAAVEKMLASP